MKTPGIEVKPIITIGKDGTNEGAIESITQCIEKHELIKIKFNKNKSSKHELSNNIVKAVNCSLVTIIGNTLIVYKQSSNLKYRHIKI